ncbi:MAG TPA: UPF0175 family protein, partial [Armatimonadota bacterium]
LTLDVPEELAQELRDLWGESELPRRALEALVLEAYREGAISRGKVGELLGLGFHAREALLKERDAPYLYGPRDLDEDLRTTSELLHPEP